MHIFATILLLIAWVSAIWGLLVFIVNSVPIMLRGEGRLSCPNFVWASLGIVFILLRLLPQVGLDL